MNNKHFKRHPDDHYYDGARIALVERWKTSGMSGDEWRFSWKVELLRKGRVVATRDCGGDFRLACQCLAWFCVEAGDSGFPDYRASDDLLCAQPGCSKDAVVTYRLKEQFSSRGEGPIPQEGDPYYRRFCIDHKRRGDCGREDSDANYEEVK